MNVVELIPAELGHIPPIAENMRAPDAEEARAMGHSATSALSVGLKGSVDCYTAMLNDRPVAMMGLMPKSIIEGEGYPWFLGTEEVYHNGKAMLALGPKVVRLWRDSLPCLSGLVAVTNARAIRYIRRLGFEVGEERTVIGGVEFVTFKMERR